MLRKRKDIERNEFKRIQARKAAGMGEHLRPGI
jgi:hypothetical protein